MVQKINFTQARIAGLDAPAKGRIEYHDAKQPKLVCRVGQSGTKSFVVLKKEGGKVRRFTLGRWPDLSVAEARDMAAKALVEIANGADPLEQKRKKKAQSLTLGQIFEQYLKDRERHLKPNTVKDYRLKFRYFEDWRNRPVAGITEAQVLSRHKEVTRAGETTANTTMRVLRLVMNYAVTLKARDDNPVRILSERKLWYRDKRRKNIIDADELPRWYAAVTGLSHQKASCFLLSMLHMGLRPDEALKIEWPDVDLKKARLVVRDPKNREDNNLPIPSALIPWFRKLHAETGSGKWVFPADRGDKPMGVPRKTIDKVIAESGVEFIPYDCRRTFATLSESVGLPLLTTKRLLNHLTDRDVTGGYVQLDENALRKAIDRISDEIMRRAHPENVASLHK